MGSVQSLLEDVDRLEVQASGIQITDALRKDMEQVLEKHGGKLEFIGHPTTTLEELFLRIVAASKAHPGRRYLPETDDGKEKTSDGKSEHIQKASGKPQATSKHVKG
jgi:ABC-2 type transport system ATP-binding protein